MKPFCFTVSVPMLSTSEVMEEKDLNLSSTHDGNSHFAFFLVQRSAHLRPRRVEDRIFSTMSQKAAEQLAHHLKEIRVSE